MLPASVVFTEDDAIAAFGKVWGELIRRILRDSWYSLYVLFDEILKTKIPGKVSGSTSELQTVDDPNAIHDSRSGSESKRCQVVRQEICFRQYLFGVTHGNV